MIFFSFLNNVKNWKFIFHVQVAKRSLKSNFVVGEKKRNEGPPAVARFARKILQLCLNFRAKNHNKDSCNLNIFGFKKFCKKKKKLKEFQKSKDLQTDIQKSKLFYKYRKNLLWTIIFRCRRWRISSCFQITFSKGTSSRRSLQRPSRSASWQCWRRSSSLSWTQIWRFLDSFHGIGTSKTTGSSHSRFRHRIFF